MKPAWRKTAALLAATTMLAGACAAKGDEDASDEDTETSGQDAGADEGTGGEPSDGQGPGSFGDLSDVCGPGDFTIAADEDAGSPDKLLIGVSNDRTSQIRPGLNKEMWDASNAFVAWCNAAGGIGGLPIEIVDLDGKLLEVEPAMARACNGVFMMVGGGQVQDNLQFTGKPDSDFHLCRLAEIPGFAVSPEKSGSNGQIQPIPNPGEEFYSGWIRDFEQVHPTEATSGAVVWGDLPSMGFIKNHSVAALDGEGMENTGVFSYPVTGLSDWTPLAQQVIGSGATSLHFTGEPTNLGALVKSLREQGWEGISISTTNHYDQTFIDSAGAENAEGSIIRSAYHPFEEAADWPATRQYIDIVNDNVDDPKIAVLGMGSFSAWLLFAEAARQCGESNDGELSRECILTGAADIDDWTGGGLHAVRDPGPEGGSPGTCEMLMVVKDGQFERLFPEVGSDDDSGDGFSCRDDAIVPVPANAGLGVVSPDQPV